MGETIATNSKAYRDFTLTDKWEAGLELKGGEVKSIRAGEVNFKNAFARIEKDEAFLHNLHIEPYLQAGHENLEPDRVRRLLLRKKEIKKIHGKMIHTGSLLLPTKVYFNQRGYAKVEIALGKSKKQYDKREDLKKRDIDRSLKRTLRTKQRHS